MWKRLSAFFVVCLMACSLLSAVSFWQKSSKQELAPAPAVEPPAIEETAAESPMVEAEPVVEGPSQDQQHLEELESALDAMSKKLESLQTEVDNTKVITNGKKSELDSLVGAIASDVEIVLADLEEKDAIIAELAEANAAQADQLAYIQGRYDKEISSKFYAKIGGAFGFKEKKVQLGLVGDMGVRIGKGLVIGTGVQYMGVTLDDGLKCDWDIDNLTVNMTVGWEW